MQMLARRLNLAARGNRLDSRPAIQPRIDVARACDFKADEPVNPAHRTHYLFGNLARSLPQLASQLECQRKRIFAELDLRRLFDHDIGDFDLVQLAQHRAQSLFKSFLLS